MRWPEAVLFDCDGTLADSEPLSRRAWTAVLDRRGVTATPADFAQVIGHAWPRSYEHFARLGPLGDRDAFRAEVRAEVASLHESELRLFPDAAETVEALLTGGVPVAVVSSSTRLHVERCLVRGGLADRIEVVVAADDVTRHKPHPEPYLLAASRLGVAVGRCTAVEDTRIGLHSARDAGAFVVAVFRGAVDRASLDLADRVVERLRSADLVPPQGWMSPGPAGRDREERI